ncbi:MAG: diguanylate cyclase [Oscillospiraceae bacterium]|nr:diguanylate cyclase [Oscillospiraceae bacterium]
MIFVNVVSIYFFVMIVAVVYACAHIRTLNDSQYAHTSVLLCFAVCFYIIGYSMELNSEGVAQILFWNRLEYVGIPFISALWLAVGLMYTGHYNRHRHALFAAIYAVPFLTLIFRLTNKYHHLYLSSIDFVREYGTLRLVKEPGIWMYVQAVHSTVMIFITMSLLLHYSIQMEEAVRDKVRLIVAASLFSVTGLALAMMKPFGLHIDYMALCLPIAGILVSVAILRYDFLEAKSTARSRVFESDRNAIVLMNQYHRIIDYNKNAKCLFDRLNVTVTRMPINKMFPHIPQMLKGLLSTETGVIQLPIDGEKRYYEFSTKKIDVARGQQGQIKTIRDVTETTLLNKNLRRQAMMDELSGLSNRRAFIQIGQKRIQKSETSGCAMYLLMMDLDYFKRVNDRYGHQMGDRVVQAFGRILKKIFSEGHLIARIGGEEFAVLLSGCDSGLVCAYAEEVRKHMEQLDFSCEEETFCVTVSVGVARKDIAGQTLDSLMRAADQALYRSKDRGRNCVTVNEGSADDAVN